MMQVAQISNPLKDVADSFTYLGYQQYGSDDTRTARAIKDYTGVIPKEQFMPGLAFPGRARP